MSRFVTLCIAIAIFAACYAAPGSHAPTEPDRIRVATFNIQELSLSKLDSVDWHGVGSGRQLVGATRILQRIRPDVVLLNEIDFDAGGPHGQSRTVEWFLQRFLRQAADSIDYPFVYVAPSNTGDLSGLDLDQDGVTADSSLRGERSHGDDSWGFGVYPGQYAMAILSRYPIDTSAVRTFQLFRWRDLPGHHMPAGFWPDSVTAVVRLSSKSHWDVPVIIGDDTLHLLASHPTPPVFDGAEDRNGRRNFDEVGFWKHYLDNHPAIVDDRGGRGGLGAGSHFVIVGDLNADPERADTTYDGVRAMAQLLGHPLVQDPVPHRGIATATFLGGTRVDYVLPGASLSVLGGGVFDPDSSVDAFGASIAIAASDHRLVWLDLRWPPQ